MSFGQAVLVAAALVAVAGLGTLVLGLRGRRVGTHPYCRRCGFDLFGLPEDRRVCPECGADLSLRRATVVGMRRRRRGLIVGGVLLLMVGLAPLGVAGWGAWRGMDWNRYRPVAWLLRDAQGGDPVAQPAALRELARRQRAKTLSAEDASKVVDAALNVQGDATRPWNTAWGDLIEGARRAGMTSEAQSSRYATQAIASPGWLGVRVPAKWRVGRSITTTFRIGTARVGSGGLLAVIRPDRTVVGDREFKEGPGGLIVMQLGAVGSGTASVGQSGSDWDLASLPLGQHSGHVIVKVRVTDPAATSALQPPSLRPPPVRRPSPEEVQAYLSRAKQEDPREAAAQVRLDAIRDAQDYATKVRLELEAERAATDALVNGTDGQPTYADVELKLPIQFELVGPGEPTATAVTDERHRAAIESALSVEKITLVDTHVDLTVRCATPPPVPLCFKVILRDGTKEWAVGRAEFDRSRSRGNEDWVTGEIPPGSPPPAPKTTKLDVVLRPDIEGDEFHMAPIVDSYWGHEVILKNVPVEDPFR